METKRYIGDVLTSKADVVVHQCNTSGGFGSGVARAVRDRFPRVYEQYRKAVGKIGLGMCQVVHTAPGTEGDRLVANLFGQESYGYDRKRYTNYEGIYTALEKLRDYCLSHGLKSVAFPWKMSCDRGGADWRVVCTMIQVVFEPTEITVEFWELKD